MADRRYPTEADKVELADLYHTARIAGKESRYDRMQWAAKEFQKAHPDWTAGSVWKSLEEALENPVIDWGTTTEDKAAKKAFDDQYREAVGVGLRETRKEAGEKAEQAMKEWTPDKVNADLSGLFKGKPKDVDTSLLKGRWQQRAVERKDIEGNPVVGPALPGQLASSRIQFEFVGKGTPPAEDIRLLKEHGLLPGKIEGNRVLTGPVKPYEPPKFDLFTKAYPNLVAKSKPPMSEAARSTVPTPELGESISKATGMKFEGMQEAPGGKPPLMVFTDPQTKSTLMAPDLDTAQTRLAAMRVKFAPTAIAIPKKQNITDKLMNEVILYGGFPMTRANVYRDALEATGEEKAADLFAFGGTTKLAPEGMRPISREEFKQLVRSSEPESGIAVGDEIRSEMDPRIRGEVANLTELFGGPAYKVKLADGSTIIVPKTDAVLLRTVKERKEGMQAMARPAEKSLGLQPGMLVRDKRLGTISHLVKELPNTQWEVRNIPGGELQRGGPSTFYIDAGAIEVLDKIPDIPDLDFALSKFGVKVGDTVSVSDPYSKATHKGILQPDGRIVGDGPDFSPNWLRLRPGDLVVQKVNAVNADKALPSRPSKEDATVWGMEAPKALQQFDKLLTQWLKAKLGSEKDTIRGKMEELLPRLSVADIDNLLAALPPGKFVLGGGLSEQDYREELLKETRRKIAARAESTQEWIPFEPQGKATHKDSKGYTFKDPKWGYTDKAVLEQSLVELKSHIGETVWVSGGGGSSGFLATLRGGRIEKWYGEEERWGIKADLLADDKVVGKKQFDPWLDSWRISFKAGSAKPSAADKMSAVASLQSIEQSRSPLSRALDESQSNAVTIDPDDPRTKIWKRDPGRMDVRGIDTPKPRVKGGTRNRKVGKVRKIESGLLRLK